MNPPKPYAVVTIYECDGDDSYLVKIGKTPDSLRAENHQHNYVSKAGKDVVLCANFRDVLNRSLKLVTAIYEDIQRKHYRGDWFVIEAGQLDTRYLRRAR